MSVSKPNCGSPSTAEHRSSANAKSLRFSVLTVSDTRTLETDTSGLYLEETFLAAGHQLNSRQIVPDEIELIRQAVVRLSVEPSLDVLLITGGTGISPRDQTPEAVAPLLELTIPGFGELFRMLSFAEIGAAAMLSRAMAGRIGSVLVFCLPGSTNAVRLAAEKLLIPELKHLVYHSRG